MRLGRLRLAGLAAAAALVLCATRARDVRSYAASLNRAKTLPSRAAATLNTRRATAAPTTSAAPAAEQPASEPPTSARHRPGVAWRLALPKAAVWFDVPRTVDELVAASVADGVVWVAVANTAFANLARNWLGHVYKLRKERIAAVVSLDEALVERLVRDEGAPCLDYAHSVERADLGSNLRSDVRHFQLYGAIKTELLLTLLLRGRDVLMSDVDVVWLADPSATFASLSPADVMVSTDCLSPEFEARREEEPPTAYGPARCAYLPGNSRGHAAFNTGVVFIRATPAGLAVAAAWHATMVMTKMGSKDAGAVMDDQFGFNLLVWHGFRNHPTHAVRSAGAGGRVIDIRMDSAPGERMPNSAPFPGWRQGWEDLKSRRRPLSSESPPRRFYLAPLEAQHFCSGHVYWIQQGAEPRRCLSVHTTFIEGAEAGKLYRLNEAKLWLLRPPEYYAPPRRFLTFSAPEISAPIPPAKNESAPTNKTDKYSAGWLLPDALNMSPRLRAHLELIRRHILALRDAFALAAALDRILILPRFPCLCDRSEAPTIVPTCKFDAADLTLPFYCPITHIISNIDALGKLGTSPVSLEIRESSFLENPRTPRFNLTRVKVATDSKVAASLRSHGGAVLLDGTSDVQARAALSAFATADILHLEKAEGVFGGWAQQGGKGAALRDHFESKMARAVYGGSWCCTSWYKPSGTAYYAMPVSTVSLPAECGDGDEAVNEERELCARLQRQRREAQRPFDPVYVLSEGQAGVDGYYRLKQRHS